MYLHIHTQISIYSLWLLQGDNLILALNVSERLSELQNCMACMLNKYITNEGLLANGVGPPAKMRHCVVS